MLSYVWPINVLGNGQDYGYLGWNYRPLGTKSQNPTVEEAMNEEERKEKAAFNEIVLFFFFSSFSSSV